MNFGIGLLREHSALVTALRRMLGFKPPIVTLSRELQAIVGSLKPGDLAVDCGANVGRVTEALAWRGATVHAFEPNPYAFAVLRQRFRFRSNVACHQTAVSVQSGTAKLFMHENSEADPVYWSTGSSLLGEKSNVNQKNSFDVETVDLLEFILMLDRPVAVLKLDVEGSEVEILERLLDTGAASQIGHVLVETHDNRMPHLAVRMNGIRQRIKTEEFRHIRLDWH